MGLYQQVCWPLSGSAVSPWRPAAYPENCQLARCTNPANLSATSFQTRSESYRMTTDSVPSARDFIEVPGIRTHSAGRISFIFRGGGSPSTNRDASCLSSDSSPSPSMSVSYSSSGSSAQVSSRLGTRFAAGLEQRVVVAAIRVGRVAARAKTCRPLSAANGQECQYAVFGGFDHQRLRRLIK